MEATVRDRDEDGAAPTADGPSGEGPVTAPGDRDARRQRVQRRAAEPVPDRSGHRAGGEGLRRRAQQTDRSEQFQQRLRHVNAAQERRERRTRTLLALAMVALLSLALLVGLVIAQVFDAPALGSGVAVGTVLAGLGGRRLAGVLARRRGAEAWDWQAGRHRVMGRPARRVQDLDRPQQPTWPGDPRR